MTLQETVIKNFTGLSTDVKPTVAAGDEVPNGSRWRDVDTGRIYHFNSQRDRWYHFSTDLKSIAGAGPTVDVRVLGVLEQINITLKKIEYHLYLASDTELKDQDVT